MHAPILAALEEHMLDVGDGHRLYWRRHGKPDAPTVVLLHGGPGGGIFPRCAEFFDPSFWNVVMYDQRGCGRSTPTASTSNNTVAHLVADLERLRLELGVERLVLHGVSWGTRLALAYGAAYPHRCAGFLLTSVFLGRRADIDWFLWDVRRLFPENHDRLLDAVAEAAGKRPANLVQLLALAGAVFASGGADQRQRLANEWDDYEWRMMSVAPMPPLPTDPVELAATRAKSLTQAILEHHYMARVLPAEDDVLEHVGRMGHLPCEIVHGRYDVICPAEQARLLADAWPQAALEIAPESGHRTFDPAMADLIHRASHRLRGRMDTADAADADLSLLRSRR